MREMRTEIEIEASKETIWKILMNFENYPEWNPFIRSISGDQETNKKLNVILDIGSKMKMKPIVQEVIPNKKFSWLGKLFIPKLFDGNHIFEIEETENGVKFIQRERFFGILVWPILKMIGKKTEKGFMAMNEALKLEGEKERNKTPIVIET